MTVRRTARCRFRLADPLPLEDRLAPAVFPVAPEELINPSVDNAGAIAQLGNFIRKANTNGDLVNTINLFGPQAGKLASYAFNVTASQLGADGKPEPDPIAQTDGGTGLPVISGDKVLIINGKGASFVRPSGAPSLRFLRAFGTVTGSTTLVVRDLTFENGNTYDYGIGGNLPQPELFPNLSGGAVRLDNASFVGVGLTFRNNTSTDDGGAVASLGQNSRTSQIKLFTSTFQSNYAGQAGGAVSGKSLSSQIGSTLEFTNCTLTDNVSLTGGGATNGVVYETDFNPARDAITGLPLPAGDPGFGLPAVPQGPNLVVSNRGTVGGTQSDLVDAVNTLFARNVGTSGPAAVVATSQMLRLRDSAVVNNQSATAGAAVGQSQGLAVELVNTTVHANLGGAPAVVATNGQVVLAFSSVTNNASQIGATAGVSVASNILTIYASVIAGNRVADPLSPNQDVVAPLVRNNGYNFFGVVPAGFQTVGTDQAGRAGAELDPRLGAITSVAGLPLVDYVTALQPVTGEAALSLAPLPDGTNLPTRSPGTGSPLLGKVRTAPPPASPAPPASRLAADARGTTRPASLIGSDIGAVQAFNLPQAAIALPGSLIPPPLPPPPAPTPTPPPPPTPSPVVRPPAVFAAGPGAALNPFVPPATSGLPAARNQKADGSPLTADASQTVPNQVRLFNPDGTVRLVVQPFDAAPPGGIRVAVADLTGDGVPDLICGTGPGVPTQVVVFDGATGAKAFTLNPFEASFTGGVFLAAGDLTGDGRPELVVSPDQGGGPRVQVLTVSGTTLSPLADFFGIDDPNFRGGARVAVGDLTGDGVGDLIVAAGSGGGPRVAVYAGGSVSGGKFTTKPIGDFFAFEQGLRDGVFVAAGDVNGDGRADLIVGAGPGGGPRVLVLDGRTLGIEQPRVVADFFAGDPADRRGVTVAVADLDGDAAADVVTGNNSTGRVTTYLGAKLAAGVAAADKSLVPFGAFQGGVFVG